MIAYVSSVHNGFSCDSFFKCFYCTALLLSLGLRGQDIGHATEYIQRLDSAKIDFNSFLSFYAECSGLLRPSLSSNKHIWIPVDGKWEQVF